MERTDYTDEARRARPTRPTRSGGRLAAGASGAVEGLAQGLEENDLGRGVGDAIDQGSRLLHAVGDGRIAQAVGQKAEVVKQKATAAIERTKEGAQAVAETGRRAAEAPPRIAEDLKEAANAWVAGVARGAGLYAAAAFAGVVALVAFTIAAAVALNDVLGDAWGTVIVAGVYVAAAATFFTMARSARERGRARAAEHLHEAREEVRSVTRPLRSLNQRKHIDHMEI